MASFTERQEVVAGDGTGTGHIKKVELYVRDEEGELVPFDAADVLTRLEALEATEGGGD